MKESRRHIAICGTKIVHASDGVLRALKDTTALYRSACNYIGNVVQERWDEISSFQGNKQKLTFVEHLIHNTKKNAAVYTDFDRLYYKFPSYYRRAVINFVLGEVSSYHTRMDDYTERRRTNPFPRYHSQLPHLKLPEGSLR